MVKTLSQIKRYKECLNNGDTSIYLLLAFFCRYIWAGPLCVLRVSTSSCWVAGTETASSAHPSPTSTPFSPRTPWTWCRERHAWKRKENAEEGKAWYVRASLLQREGVVEVLHSRSRWEGSVGCSLFIFVLYFFLVGCVWGLRHRWFGLLPHQTLGKTNPSFR